MRRSRSTSNSPRRSSRLVQRLLGPAERKPASRRRRLRSELLEDRRLLVGWTQQDQALAFSDPIDPQSDAYLGNVAVDGDLMAVGATRDDRIAADAGAVYLYRRDDAGTPGDSSDDFWRNEAVLTATDAAAGDNFGQSVSISGDTVVVGSPRDGDAGDDVGAAYVFTQDGSSWSEQAKLTAGDPDYNDEFGISVSVSGDTVVVGSHEDDDFGASSGSAYIFTRSGASWSQQAKLTASDSAAYDFFGRAVSVSGDTVVVGSIGDDDADGFHRGAAYVFTRSGTSWIESAKLIARDVILSRRFGHSVSIFGDTIVVGDRDGRGSAGFTGVAYVFSFDGASWSEQAKLIASDPASSNYFGSSVSVSEDTIVVGSYGDDDAGPYTNSGSAYVFTRSGTSWTEQEKLTASDADSNDLFGGYVAVSGDTVVVGSTGDDVVKDGVSFDNAGSAYAFIARDGSWSQQAQVFAFSDGPQASARHGTSVAVAGDLMVVGAPLEDNKARNAGAVYIYRRDDAGTELDLTDDFWVDEARLTASDGARGDNFGDSVAVFGDTVVVGSPRDNDDGGDSGSAYVFTYSNTGWSEQAKLTASDAAADDRFGQSITIYEDTLVVGSPNNALGGAAYVFTGSGGSWSEQAKLIASDPGFRHRFGESVSVSGDTVVVGSSEAGSQGDGGFTSGSAYVFIRSGAAWTEQEKLKASDAAANDRFGRSVSISGDTAVVGSWLDDDDGYNSGSAYVFVRSGTGWSEQAKLRASDGERYNSFGESVSVSGDTIVVGSSADEDQSFSYSGSAYVFARRGTNWSEQAKLIANDAARDDFFGHSVSISGDIVVVGSYRDDVIQDGIAIPDAGSAYVFVPESIPVDYDFNSAAFAATEGDTTNTSNAVTLTRSDASVAETVEVTLTDGTATAGSDFTSGPISVFFDAGEVTKPVPIEILGDLTVEADQSLTLSLTSFSESGRVGTTIPTATFTINNDDTAAVMLADLSQNEESGTFTFQASLDNPVEGGFMVDYSIAGVDTESGDLTGPLTGTLTFAGAANEAHDIVVTVDDDVIVEADESFTVSLGTISPLGTPPVDASDVDTSDTATGTIVNTDTAAISIGDASVVEGSGGTTELVLTITSTNPSEEDLTIQVDTAEVPGQALGGGVDFTDVVGAIATIAGDGVSTSTSVTVVLNADYIVESDETLAVNLTEPQFGGSSDSTRVQLGDDQAIGTILDDDLENSAVVGDHPCGDESGAKAIFFNGSALDDRIEVRPGVMDGTFTIEISSGQIDSSVTSLGTFKFEETASPADHDAVIGAVVIYGLDGNDEIKIEGGVGDLRGFLFGGAGDDKIKGGNSDDVLIGGSGDDKMDGHQGRDIAIGGTGADKIKGNKDEDVLIGGSTDYDDNHLVALCAIMDEWTRTDNTFQDRVNNVSNGSGDSGARNGAFTLENHVQLSDGAVDDLKGGGSHSDWFIASEADGDTYDELKDGEAFWSDVESLFFET